MRFQDFVLVIGMLPWPLKGLPFAKMVDAHFVVIIQFLNPLTHI
jgi:hypothetical protein